MEQSIAVVFFLCLAVVCTSAVSIVSRFLVDNDRPIIGVAAQETPTGTSYGDTYIPASYIKYLEQAGARVVPVRAKEPMEYYVDLFEKLNGILFPGGAVSLTESYYARTGRIFYNLSIQAADRGEIFPLWGTCLGFELLNTITAGENLLQNTDSDNLTLPLDFLPDFRNSRMFGQVPEDVLQYLKSEPVTQNEHMYSMLNDVFYHNSKLHSFYKVLSTNKGRKGKEFISTFEAYKYPIYGTQWHPEKNAFNWNPNYVINHSAHAVRVAQYMANFFVNEARKSTHRFKSAMDEATALIDNFNPVFFADGTFNEMYFFNYTASAQGVKSGSQYF